MVDHIEVQANNFDRMWAECRSDYLSAVDQVGRSGWYILGQQVESFENALATYCNSPAAVGCGNGMDALEIALRVHGIGPGDRVLTSPLSAFPTALGIVRAGAEPVFCDVDEFGLMDPIAAAAALKSVPRIKALMPVHLYGSLADIPALAEVAERAGAVVIEDAAQAIGARRRGIEVGGGSTGAGMQKHISCFSFYPTKNLGAVGDGGALILPDRTAEVTAQSLRNYGQSARYVHDLVGMNSRLDEIHAATLRLVFLPRLPAWLARRREIASRYMDEVTTEHVRALGSPDPEGSGWHLFPVLVAASRREDFLRHLSSNGVQAALHYPTLITEQKAFTNKGEPLVADELSQAQKLCASEVSLPLHPYLNDDEVTHVIRTVQSWRG